jgi:DNA-binding transcriptional LysR family regulator
MVEDYIQSGKLIEILQKYNKIQLPIYIYYRHQTYPDPKVHAFIEYFIENNVAE